MVERVDYECDVLTHINADIVWLGEKLRCLVDNVSCENLIDKTFIISLVKFFKTVSEKAECACKKYSLGFALL